MTVHALDYLRDPSAVAPAPVCVLFGDESFLKREALLRLRAALGCDEESPPVVFGDDDRDFQWKDVVAELSTVSLFGGAGAKRVVVVRDADKFVSANRTSLEEYVEKPKRTGTLVLTVSTWQGNTRLYKLVETHGLAIEAKPPEVARGKSKAVDDAAILKWLHDRAEKVHKLKLKPAAGKALFDLVGPNLGMLDQDLAKLALLIPAKETATPEQVQSIVGGWRAKTAWDMIDAACDGDAAGALEQLDRLIRAGEEPIAVFGQIAWSLRRYHAATRFYERALRGGGKSPIREALLAGGFFQWPQGALDAAEARLKQIGRERASRIMGWLSEVDVSLKGSHSESSRARFALEQLFLRLGKK